MKTTVLFQDKVRQIALTPETPWEEEAFKLFPEECLMKLRRGSFFNHCQGGWVREFKDHDKSIILVQEAG